MGCGREGGGDEDCVVDRYDPHPAPWADLRVGGCNDTWHTHREGPHLNPRQGSPQLAHAVDEGTLQSLHAGTVCVALRLRIHQRAPVRACRAAVTALGYSSVRAGVVCYGTGGTAHQTPSVRSTYGPAMARSSPPRT